MLRLTRLKLVPLAAAPTVLATVLGLLVGLAGPSSEAIAATPPTSTKNVSGPAMGGGADLGPFGTTEGTGMIGYRLYDALPGGLDLLSVDALGPDGQIAGRIRDTDGDGLPEPFVQTPGTGGIQQLTAVPNSVNRVTAFDADGNLYGYAGDGEGSTRGAVWRWDNYGGGSYGDPQVVAYDDQIDPSATAGISVVDVNAQGHVLLGNGAIINGTTGAVIRHAVSSYGVYGMNDHDTTAGAIEVDPDGPQGPEPSYRKPVLWKADGTEEDQPFPPLVWESARARRVGAHDEVLVEGDWFGTASGTIEQGIPFLRHADGSYEALLPPSGSSSDSAVWARDMSSSGDVVGETYNKLPDGSYNERATLWSHGRVLDMNKLLVTNQADHWKLTTAFAINDKGMIAGEGSHDGVFSLWLAVPVDPVVFVHGAGASSIYSYSSDQPDQMLWLGCAINHDRAMLSLDPADIADGTAPADTRAVDALRHEHCGVAGEWVDPALNVYGTLLDRLVGSGSYREYQREGVSTRQTGAGCDVSQANSTVPNLFVYAYDWRRDNAQSAAGLAEYVKCVHQFWPDRKIDIVTHSMGGLVARRYLLDFGGQDVDRMITIAAPWLGAPKLVDVLQTGNFAPPAVNGPRSVIKHIVATFPAAHELMASRIYGDASPVPVLRENGWDLNGKGGSFQRYSYQDVKQLLDEQNPTYKPGTTGDNFQSYTTEHGSQTDWRTDATGVKFTHIIGLQAGAQTIGTVVANDGMVCEGTFSLTCTQQKYISEYMVCGDGTVPLVSAERAGQGVDYNDPTAEFLEFRAEDTGSNQSVEHTGLASNPGVDEAILDRLFSTSDERVAQDHSWLGQQGDAEWSCLQNPSPSGFVAAGVSTDPAPGTSLRYISVLDGKQLTVADTHGHTTDPQGDTLGYLEGVTMVPSDRADAGMAITPLSDSETYTTTFVGTGRPVELSLLEGSQQHPTGATRWTDVPLAQGATAELMTTADGRDTLHIDTDGDGEPDTLVPPTVRLGGSDAADVTAPKVSGTKLVGDAGTVYALSATDQGSGVESIQYSTDGTHFSAYTGPITVDEASTSEVVAFATDRAGNRSAPYVIALADLVPGTLTTASVDPQPNGTGWNTGPVTVRLDAEASSGTSPIASVTYRTDGADGTQSETVDGPSAELAVSASGTTTVTYFATAADGTREPERTLTVRIDGSDPTARVRKPAPGAVVESLATIAGTASDDASGVTRVEIELRNGSGYYWDGTSWVTPATWLGASGKTTWSRSAGLPTGDQLATGPYRVRLRVTDGSGRVATTEADSFMVATTAGIRISELSAVDGQRTTGTDINTHGVAVGVTTLAGRTAPVRWRGGAAEVLPLGRDCTDGQALAVDETDTAYGWVFGPAQSGCPLTMPVRWDVGSAEPTRLSTLDDSGRGEVSAVNSDGSVAVGWSADYQPVRWSGSKVRALPLLAGATDGRATGVADDGTIVGWETTPSGPRAVLWPAEGGVVNLGTVGNDPVSRATAVNALGTVVGISIDAGGRRHGFIYDNGLLQYVTGSFSATSLTPKAINDDGVVVGEYQDASGTTRGFVADPGAAGVDLDSRLPSGSGWTTAGANAVNEMGQVVGLGINSGRFTGYLVGPVHAPVVDDLDVKTDVGRPVTLTVPAYDPDVTDALTLAVGDGPSHGTVGDIVDGVVTYTPADGFDGTDRFTVVADDGEFPSVPGVVTVTVGSGGQGGGDNHPPTLSLSGPSSADEGDTVQLLAEAADPDGDPLTWSWSTDGGELSADGSSAALRMLDGPGTVTVSVTVSDGTESVARRLQIDVRNVDPTVDAGPDRSLLWGEEATFTGSATDPAPADVIAGLDATWDFGDGTIATGLTAAHTWAEPGTYVVTLTGTDKDGGTSTDTTTVTVGQHQPVLRIVSPESATFGTTSVMAELTDPDAGGAAVPNQRVDFDIDGTITSVVTDTSGQALLPSHSLLPGEHHVTAVAAADDRYLVGTATQTLVVTQSKATVLGALSTTEGDVAIVAWSDGTRTGGLLQWDGKRGPLLATLTALGRTRGASGHDAVWLAGFASGHLVLAYLEEGGRTGRGEVFRLWIDGTEVTSTGLRSAGVIAIV